MAIRRRSTAEVLPPEQDRAPSSPQTPARPTTPEAAKGNGQAAAPSRSDGPQAVEPMSQNRNAADLEDRIRQRAYEIYEQRGRIDNHALDDWLEAKAEILGVVKHPEMDS